MSSVLRIDSLHIVDNAAAGWGRRVDCGRGLGWREQSASLVLAACVGTGDGALLCALSPCCSLNLLAANSNYTAAIFNAQVIIQHSFLIMTHEIMFFTH